MHREDTHTLTWRAFAGLLCLIGALILASCSTSTEATVPPEPAAESAPTPALAVTEDQELQQVLVAVEVIPRNTSAAELVAAPTVYLSEQFVPVDIMIDGAIRTVAELQELKLDNMVLTADVLPGEQLLRSRFKSADFFPDAPTPEAAEVPDGDEELQQVLVVVETIPQGTSVRELVDAPTVYLSARAVPAQFVASGAITTVGELQELSGMVLTVDALPGEQLLRSSFTDPATFTDAPSPVPTYEVPPGHDVHVLVLPPGPALGGFVWRGDNINAIATETRPSGEATWVYFFDFVEVLAVESSLPRLPADQLNYERPESYTITIALPQDETVELEAALEQSATIRLTSRSEIPGEQAAMIEMSRPQALDGAVRRGDVVNVVALAGPGAPSSESVVIASDVDVLSVLSSFEPAGLGDAALESDVQPHYSVLLSLTLDELLVLAAVDESGELALERP